MPLLPSPLLSREQQEFALTIQRMAEDRLVDPNLRVRERAGEFWPDGWKQCAAAGLCGLPVPDDLGGGGADRVTTAAALEALGYGCTDAGLVFSINAHLWSAVVPLWQFGTPAQQERYLRPLCRGEWIGLHAMTEPESGSDAFSLRTTATPDGSGFVLRGRKTFITNAPIADLLLIFARSPGSTGGFGVTGYLVEATAPGLSIESSTDKLGLRTSPMADVVLDDVRVAGDAVLGKPGRGAQIFTASMEWERSLIMAGQLGSLRSALDDACDYARTRQQFGRPIGDFESVSDKLADIHVGLEAARALLYETAWRYDNGARGAALAAGVKLFSAELVLRASLDLLQVHGGSGFTTDLDFERRLRDAVGGRIYSGTSEIMRRLVAKELGL